MAWLVIVMIGIVLGTLFSYIALNLKMPQSLSITLAVIGALAGASLDRITNMVSFGEWTFYVIGAVVSIGFLAGGALAYKLTSEEIRL
jgi:uncharacterized membrane protein YeaQ/YmgE (transglycosylase-associated protein family)